MRGTEELPKIKNIPDLHGNIEGLKRHSFLSIFIAEPNLSQDDRKLRSWLLHTVASAARHYLKARDLVYRQENADQQRDGGAIFHILDVSEEIEDCITAMYRACMAIKRLNISEKAEAFSKSHAKPIQDLQKIRNQFDHMHSQITAGETGSGPISIVFGDAGRTIKFRRLSMTTSDLGTLIDGAYQVVAGLYPGFNVSSPKEPGGPVKLTLQASIKVTEADGTTRIIK